MEAISLAAIAFFSWGISDFSVYLLAKGRDFSKILFQLHFLGCVALFFYCLFMGNLPLKLSLLDLGKLSIGSLLYSFGWMSYLKALKHGNLSIISPIASSFGVISLLVGIFYFGEKLSEIQIGAVLMVIIGVTISTINLHSKPSRNTLYGDIGFAVLSMICWGVLPLFWRIESLDNSSVTIVLITKFIASLLFGFLCVKEISKDHKSNSISLSLSPLLILAAVTDASALIAYTIGISINISLVAPIASSYASVSMIIGALFIKEKNLPHQWIGALLVLMGIILASL